MTSNHPAVSSSEQESVADLSKQLREYVSAWPSLVVAFSGGVDSSVVLAAAVHANVRVIAVTAKSPSVPKWQVDLANEIAQFLNAEHQVIETTETQDQNYRRNDGERCYYCKSTLYRCLEIVASKRDAVLVSGTNADDLGDYRPGIQAGRQREVQTPLADLAIGKIDVRRLAEYWGLPNADTPASPCLASRIAYGVEVTPERLFMIEQAESWLRAEGFSDCRVRLHPEELARIEVPVSELKTLYGQLASDSSGLPEHFVKLGFRYVTVDTAGLRSGNLNASLREPKLVTLSTSRSTA